jgi:hypothetical protein
VGDDGARALAESPHLTRLKELDLTQTNIGTAGALALAAAPNLDNVEVLLLRWNPFDNTARRALRTRFKRRVAM